MRKRDAKGRAKAKIHRKISIPAGACAGRSKAAVRVMCTALELPTCQHLGAVSPSAPKEHGVEKCSMLIVTAVQE